MGDDERPADVRFCVFTWYIVYRICRWISEFWLYNVCLHSQLSHIL